MRRPRIRSLRATLLAQMSALFVLGMIGLYWAASAYATLAADRSYDRLLAGSALAIAESLTVTPEGVRVDIPYSALDMLAAAPDDRMFYRVVAPDGRTVTGDADLPPIEAAAAEAPDGLGASERFFDTLYRGETVRFVVLGRESSNLAQKGWTWIQVGQTRNARQDLSRELLVQSLLPILLMTIVALGAVWVGIGRALRPLVRVRAALSARQPSDLSPLQTDVPDELRPIIEGINDFMGRLQGNIELLRNFIANTAHQLRTPLAALIVQLQMVERASEEDRRHGLAVANRSAKKLSRLIDQLLSDALIEHRSSLREIAEFDLKAVIASAVRETVSAMEDHDVRFASPLATAPMTGDRLVLEEAIKNVLHNALTHGTSDDPVEIALDSTETGYRLTVCDRGAGIPPDQLATVFDRFRRGSGNTLGAGLGLSIVRQAVDQHNGRVVLENRQGGGTCVTLELPT
ncbi:MAG: sensor histidine kinase [Qipengyuania sp.]|nr:sensor histidine kinase [Qipengyuania sp.]